MAELSPSILEELATVALQGYQFLYNADRFMSGKVLCRYRPDIRAGEIVKIGGVPPITAYVEAVEHSMVALSGGELEFRTVVTYSRGLTDESQRTYVTRGF